jgi:hypothetical protein
VVNIRVGLYIGTGGAHEQVIGTNGREREILGEPEKCRILRAFRDKVPVGSCLEEAIGTQTGLTNHKSKGPTYHSQLQTFLVCNIEWLLYQVH